MRYSMENFSAIGIGIMLGAFARPPWGRHVLFALALAVLMGGVEAAFMLVEYRDRREEEPNLPNKTTWQVVWGVGGGAVFLGFLSWAPVILVVGLVTYGFRRLIW
jgi:hypothetical protein